MAGDMAREAPWYTAGGMSMAIEAHTAGMAWLYHLLIIMTFDLVHCTNSYSGGQYHCYTVENSF